MWIFFSSSFFFIKFYINLHAFWVKHLIWVFHHAFKKMCFNAGKLCSLTQLCNITCHANLTNIIGSVYQTLTIIFSLIKTIFTSLYASLELFCHEKQLFSIQSHLALWFSIMFKVAKLNQSVCAGFTTFCKGLQRPRLIALAGAGSNNTWTTTESSEAWVEARQDDYIKGICSPGILCFCILKRKKKIVLNDLAQKHAPKPKKNIISCIHSLHICVFRLVPFQRIGPWPILS